MRHVFPSLNESPVLGEVFRRFPNSARPLCQYHDRVLRDYSPLTIAERELIAAFTSALNACSYCFGAHATVAKALGVDAEMLERLVVDIDSSGIASNLQPIFRYVRKLTLTPSRLTDDDSAAVYAAGWDEQALFDAISVCALFNLMNRIVEGSGLSLRASARSEDDPKRGQGLMKADLTVYQSAHEGPEQYTLLLRDWGIEP